MKRIYINISDVASYIGQNKWDFITPFERLWKKCDNNGYNKVLDEYNNEEEINNIKRIKNDIKTLEEEIQRTDEVGKKKKLMDSITTCEKTVLKLEESIKINDNIIQNNINGEEKLKKLINEETLEQINNGNIKIDERKDILKNAIEKLDINVDKRRDLLLDGQSLINKAYGTKEEESAIDLVEKRFKIKLDTSQKYYSSVITKTDDYIWCIGGKMDGIYINEDENKSYIVEVKNRVNGFFNRLRDYEKTQIQLYMKISEISHAKLVEKYNNTIRITDVYKDLLYINDTVESLTIFLVLFETFLKDISLQTEYIILDNEHKKRWIYNKFFNKIEEKCGDECKI